MIDKKYRKEVEDNHRPYMDNEQTVEDLIACCKLCSQNDCLCNETDPVQWCSHKDSCPIYQLWLSNEYLEWADSWR